MALIRFVWLLDWGKIRKHANRTTTYKGSSDTQAVTSTQDSAHASWHLYDARVCMTGKILLRMPVTGPVDIPSLLGVETLQG